MSSIAFDKQGKPFSFLRRTSKLLVRLFRNPSARGTCCQVLDAEGKPMYLAPDTDYAEFRKAVGHVPGLYRLDQCDEDGNELDDAPPAYVSVDVMRNAQGVDMSGGGGDVSPLVIIQQMAAVQADVMKTMAAQQAALIAAAAEILRAPYRPAPAAVTTELRNASSTDSEVSDDELEDDEIEEEVQPEHPISTAMRMLEPHLPQLGGFLYDKCAEFVRSLYGKNAASAPATTPPTTASVQPVAASTATSQTGASAAVVAGAPSTTPTAPPSAPCTDSPVASGATTDDAADPTTVPQTAQTIAGAPTAPKSTVTPIIPTREELAHLQAIRARLTSEERAIAESAISQMDPLMLGQWLAALSARSVDEATALLRDWIAEIPRPDDAKTPR